MPMHKQIQASCIAASGSMTRAVRAQRALLAAGIRAEVVALSPEDTRQGCAFGVEYPCTEERRARIALRNARVPISQYLHKERDVP